jgi:nitroimidazol reductase NimA-like FMN-containing flavoprotein (pyridoxamine 5'-phosphate oxidase superfamily)
MLDKMKELVREKDICVLSTVSGNKPHCSLMSYTTDSERREFYMVTSRETRKFKNLTDNPNVSLLIDTREEHMGPHRNQASALTVSGRIEEIRDINKQREISLLLLERHPHLEELFKRDDTAILCVKADSFLLLKGISEAYYEKL